MEQKVIQFKYPLINQECGYSDHMTEVQLHALVDTFVEAFEEGITAMSNHMTKVGIRNPSKQ